MFSFKRVTFVGFGLLASSIAAAFKQAKEDVIVRAVSSPKRIPAACPDSLQSRISSPADETPQKFTTAKGASSSAAKQSAARSSSGG